MGITFLLEHNSNDLCHYSAVFWQEILPGLSQEVWATSPGALNPLVGPIDSLLPSLSPASTSGAQTSPFGCCPTAEVGAP